MGKGSGKGGCLPVWEELDLYEQVIIILSCLIGPGLIIAGIVLISTDANNEREVLIGNYTDSIALFESTDAQFSKTDFYYGGELFETNNQQDVLDDSGSWPTYTPIKYQITVPASLAAAGLTVWANLPSNQTFFLPSISYSDPFSASQTNLNCRTPTTPCSSGPLETECNAKPFCSEYCQNLNGVWDETQYTCSGVHYLSEICVRLDDSSGSWVVGIGCYFQGHNSPTSLGNVDPNLFFWTPGVYTPFQKNTTLITLRYTNDPYIVASQVTSGTYYFGETLVQSITTGIIVLAVGAGFEIIDVVLVLLFIYWTQTAGRGRKGKIANGGLESRNPSQQVDMEENLIPSPPGKKHAPGHETYDHGIKPITRIIPIYPLDQTPTRTESTPGAN